MQAVAPAPADAVPGGQGVHTDAVALHMLYWPAGHTRQARQSGVVPYVSLITARKVGDVKVAAAPTPSAEPATGPPAMRLDWPEETRIDPTWHAHATAMSACT